MFSLACYAFSGGSIASTSLFALYPCWFHWQKDAKILPTDTRDFFEKKTKEIAQKLGISKNLEIKETDKNIPYGLRAHGINSFSGRAGLIMNPYQFQRHPRQLQELILTTELSIIKSDFLFYIALTPGLIGAIHTLVLSLLFPPQTTSKPILVSSIIVMLGIGISWIGVFINAKEAINRVDALNCNVCSSGAKLTAIKNLSNTIKFNLIQREGKGLPIISQIWRKILITEDGETRYAFPSLKTRLAIYKSSQAGQGSNI